MDEGPVWVTSTPKHEPADCEQDKHLWIASFFWSGHLSYWQCAGCGLTDRETDNLPERLAKINGWIESPPTLTFRGAHPPARTARWTTDRGTVLVEGDPSSIHFVGMPIPELPEAHSYEESGANGKVQETYTPSREPHSRWGDHYTLIRFQVVNDELVEFRSHCHTESTFDVPKAQAPRTRVILSGLRRLHS